MPTATFYNSFSKRPNSTKRPTGGTNATIKLNEPTDIFNPTVIVRGSNFEHVTYMQMDGWYYYVDKVVYNPPYWEITGRLDELATAKDEITATNVFIERCADSDKTQTYCDNLCIINGTLLNSDDIHATIPAVGTSTGAYAVCCLGKTGPAYYYLRDKASLDNFVNEICKQGTDLGNIMNFFRDVRWIPFVTPSASVIPVLSIADKDIQLDGLGIFASVIPEGSTPFTLFTKYLGAHPQASELGSWLNFPPYSMRKLYHPLVGEVPIPFFGSTLSADGYVDNKTGNCIVSVKVDSNIIAQRSFNISVPVLTGGIVEPTTASILSAGFQLASQAGMATGAAVGAAMGNPALVGYAVSGTCGTIATAANIFSTGLCQYGTSSNNGSWNLLSAPGEVLQRFSRVSVPDYGSCGKPYMASDSIGNHSGYLKASNGDVQTVLPEPYKKRIMNTIMNGIFIE